MANITIKLPKPETLETVINEMNAEPKQWLGEQIMPAQQTDKAIIEYTTIEQAAGMTAPHELGTDPRIDKRKGGRQMRYEPAYFKESDLFGEKELLALAQMGGSVLDLRAVVAQTLRERYNKTRLREEWLRWMILQGQLYINENGVFVNERFNIQRYVPTVGFDDAQNSKPIAEFSAAIKGFKSTGASGKGAKAYLNSETYATIAANRNTQDLLGLRDIDKSLDLDDIDAVNRRLKTKGLIQLEINDDEYTDGDGTTHYFVRTGNIVIVANAPTQEKVGTFWETASLHKLRNGRPYGGYFSLITVNDVPNNSGSAEVSLAEIGAGKNPKLELTGGVYGGPELRYANRVMLFEAFDNNQNQ